MSRTHAADVPRPRCAVSVGRAGYNRGVVGRPKGSRDRNPRKRRSDARSDGTAATSVRLCAEDRAWLASEAVRRRVSVSEMVRRLIAEARGRGGSLAGA